MLKRIHQHLFLISTVLFAVLIFFFQMRLSGDSAKVSDMAALIVCCAFFCWSAIAGFLEELERKLNKWLDPKTGYAPQASAPIDTYPQRSHRHDLEHSLVHALAGGLHNRMDGAGVGAFIRAAADAILGGGVPGTKPTCSCSFKEKCSNCFPWLNADQIAAKNLAAKLCQHTAATYSALQQASRAAADKASFGAQADQRAEAEIVAAGLTAPRVTAEQIQALMSSLTWRYDQPEGTTSTFAHAFLGRFYLVTGHSGCVSPENFDAALGMKYAREQAEGKARDKLWELEGYKLMCQLNGEEA